MARIRSRGTELSVFKGREARLNRAIFQVLIPEEPQSTRELHKRIIRIKGMRGTSYSTVNKRVRSLEGSGYVKKVEVKERPGGITNYYKSSPRAHLATFFDSTTIEDLLSRIDDATAKALLQELVRAKAQISAQ